jgi:hypothetical protein
MMEIATRASGQRLRMDRGDMVRRLYRGRQYVAT